MFFNCCFHFYLILIFCFYFDKNAQFRNNFGKKKKEKRKKKKEKCFKCFSSFIIRSKWNLEKEMIFKKKFFVFGRYSHGSVAELKLEHLLYHFSFGRVTFLLGGG